MTTVWTGRKMGSRVLTGRRGLKTLYRKLDRGNDYDVQVIILGLRLSTGVEERGGWGGVGLGVGSVH